jgi:putative ABC transport system ATP-binding protein
MMQELSVSIKKLVKSFKTGAGSQLVLRDISLDVMQGEIMLIVGPSGSGKTTLLSIIAGLLSYDGGECSIFAHDYVNMTQADILDFRAKNLGFVFQSYNLVNSLTVVENVVIPMLIRGVPFELAIKQAQEMLAKVELISKADTFPSQLSGGEQQRIAIARALINKPKLLICDEPTSALDHETGQKIMQLIVNLNHELNTTVIIVTHDNRIFHHANRIANIDDGVINYITNIKEQRHE